MRMKNVKRGRGLPLTNIGIKATIDITTTHSN